MNNLDKIRNMSDEELNRYLNSLSGNKLNNCVKCGALLTRKTIIINNKNLLSQKKLCNICDNCYKDLLKFLETPDIFWE